MPASNDPHGEEEDAVKNIPSKPDVPKEHPTTTNAKGDGLDRWKAIVETLTLVAVIYYASVARGQLGAIRNSNIINKTSTDLVNRPYIGLNSVTLAYVYKDSTGATHFSQIPTTKTNVLDYRAEIKNFGPVPGLNYVGRWRVFLGGEELPSAQFKDSPFTFFPGQILALSDYIPSQIYPSVISGQKQLRVEVTVEYDGPSGHYKECEKSQFAPIYNTFYNLGPCNP